MRVGGAAASSRLGEQCDPGGDLAAENTSSEVIGRLHTKGGGGENLSHGYSDPASLASSVRPASASTIRPGSRSHTLIEGTAGKKLRKHSSDCVERPRR